ADAAARFEHARQPRVQRQALLALEPLAQRLAPSAVTHAIALAFELEHLRAHELVDCAIAARAVAMAGELDVARGSQLARFGRDQRACELERIRAERGHAPFERGSE